MSIPEWVNESNYPYASYEEIPPNIFDSINKKLERIQQPDPKVSILITAYNEEVNILRCLSSIASMKTFLPLEIIVVNNNSTDKTQLTLDRLNVKKLFQGKQGCGPARQLGQENAKGKYIFLADADCIYPPNWLEEMIRVLQKPGTACVYGRYSFIPGDGYPRWKLFDLT